MELRRTPRPIQEEDEPACRLASELVQAIHEENERARRLLPQLVQARGWGLWQPGAEPSDGATLVLGVANWSGHDLALLDAVSEGLSKPSSDVPRVEVFDIDDAWRDGHVATHFPDFTTAHGPPIAALLRGGRREDSAYGSHVRTLIERLLGARLVWDPHRWQYDLRK